ncbi:hypothetical protein BDZ89DRAFT_1198149 [Hymenopellis radicata]|nr:hypothetical protein BDZ89DRAFT_1198149 [Hymenopellis radicata]
MSAYSSSDSMLRVHHDSLVRERCMLSAKSQADKLLISKIRRLVRAARTSHFGPLYDGQGNTFSRLLPLLLTIVHKVCIGAITASSPLDSEPQPDNITMTDGPDVQQLRAIALTEDPGYQTWPHQMRYEEVKNRIGEVSARAVFFKMKAMDKAHTEWRSKAICVKCENPEFKCDYTLLVHINWVTADLIKKAVVKKIRNQRFLKKTVSPEKQQAYIERATAKHGHRVDRRPELPQRKRPDPAWFAARPIARMTARPIARMTASHPSRRSPSPRHPPSPPNCSYSSEEEDAGDSDSSADTHVDEVKPHRVRGLQGKPLEQQIYANRWGHHSVTGRVYHWRLAVWSIELVTFLSWRLVTLPYKFDHHLDVDTTSSCADADSRWIFLRVTLSGLPTAIHHCLVFGRDFVLAQLVLKNLKQVGVGAVEDDDATSVNLTVDSTPATMDDIVVHE